MTQTFDDYISTYVVDENDVQYEVHFGLYHGYGTWTFWTDTGYEFDIKEEVELIFQEAYTDEGVQVKLSKELVSKAEDIAAEHYWERYAEGAYN
jgi:hypothetical protein